MANPYESNSSYLNFSSNNSSFGEMSDNNRSNDIQISKSNPFYYNVLYSDSDEYIDSFLSQPIDKFIEFPKEHLMFSKNDWRAMYTEKVRNKSLLLNILSFFVYLSASILLFHIYFIILTVIAGIKLYGIYKFNKKISTYITVFDILFDFGLIIYIISESIINWFGMMFIVSTVIFILYAYITYKQVLFCYILPSSKRYYIDKLFVKVL